MLLDDVIKFAHWDDCRVHLASWNNKEHPLDVFVRSRDEWKGWNEWRGDGRDIFNRTYIFSLIQLYDEPQHWLFGGFFRVRKRSANGYKVDLCPNYEALIGRLKVHFRRSGRQRVLIPDNCLGYMTVAEVLRKAYAGEAFPGYEHIDIPFAAMETVVRESRLDWKAALKNVKGIYLITDDSNGRKYVGSAYGNDGLWSRWTCYVGTGHGWNDELTKLIADRGIEYARANFKFTLLEYRSMKTDDRDVLEREAFWKKALLTRGAFGYNKN